MKSLHLSQQQLVSGGVKVLNAALIDSLQDAYTFNARFVAPSDGDTFELNNVDRATLLRRGNELLGANYMLTKLSRHDGEFSAGWYWPLCSEHGYSVASEPTCRNLFVVERP